MINCEKLKELMKAKGFDTYTLADAAGVSQPMVSFVVRGLREPSLAVLGRMASALGVKVADLLDEPSDGEVVIADEV